ncbi:MAG: M20/M25/M40 family metallo-hydrolase [Cytophagaceae bacterium]
MFRKISYGLVSFILIGLCIILFRTVTFHSKQIKITKEPVQLPISERSISNLSKAIQFPSISYDDAQKKDSSAFLGLIDFIHEAYPQIRLNLQREVINDLSILYTWKGKDTTLPPAILTGHLDVVPVEDNWKYPPFSGLVKNDTIYGRGAIDDKGSIISILESIEILLSEGYQPPRTLILAFGHDEEIRGRDGAKAMATLLHNRGVRAEFVLDEGGMIVDGIVPGLEKPVALIGTAEKGYVTVELICTIEGGHSSMPKYETAIDVLGKAVDRLMERQFEPHISLPMEDFMNHIGPEMPFISRMAFANRGLFQSLILNTYTKSHQGNAVVRTTTAPTIFQSGTKENVIPSRARAVVNFRTLPGVNSQDVINHIENVIGDQRIKISFSGDVVEASPVSPIDSPGFAHLRNTIARQFPDAIISPYLVTGGTDAKEYAVLTENIYRFLPFREMQGFHGKDERLSIRGFNEAIQFYYTFIKHLP